jgi:hypothetical protein
MHWLLTISAVLAAWIAVSFICFRLVFGLLRRGLCPTPGPFTGIIISLTVRGKQELDAWLSPRLKAKRCSDVPATRPAIYCKLEWLQQRKKKKICSSARLNRQYPAQLLAPASSATMFNHLYESPL